MRSITLFFSSQDQLVNFIFENCITRTQVHSKELRLTTELTEEEVHQAKSCYGAREQQHRYQSKKGVASVAGNRCRLI